MNNTNNFFKTVVEFRREAYEHNLSSEEVEEVITYAIDTGNETEAIAHLQDNIDHILSEKEIEEKDNTLVKFSDIFWILLTLVVFGISFYTENYKIAIFSGVVVIISMIAILALLISRLIKIKNL